MITGWRQSVARNAVSPVGLALFSYSLFLLAWCFPPDLYTYYVSEPDRMYLNMQLFTFYTCCVISFLLGHYCYTVCSRPGKQLLPSPFGGDFASATLCIPIIVASFFCAIFLMKFGAKIDFLAMLSSHQGGTIKAAGVSGDVVEGGWGSTVIYLTAVLWWALYRSFQVVMPAVDRLLFTIVFALGFAVDLAVCVATVDRTNLMPLIAGLFIIYIFRSTSGPNPRFGRLVMIFVSASSIVAALFAGLSLLRGASALRFLVTSFLGYSIVSYNRLASILSGTMTYAFAGHGAYLFPMGLSDDHINAIIPLRTLFGWATPPALFLSEFSSVAASGLNSGYIWSGAFGYIYSEIGWWTLLYLAALGAVAGYFWSSFREGNALSVVIYLWLAFSILFWIGGNLLFHERFIHFVAIAFALFFYERLFLAHGAAPARSPAVLQNRVSV